MRRRLHALDGDGRMLTGADVAIAVWRETPGQAWRARLLGNRLVLPLARFGYDCFAGLHYAWNRRKGHW